MPPAPRCPRHGDRRQDPTHPHAIWQGNLCARHDLSDDGNRAYVADPTGGEMLIMDTSQIQARKPNPQAREISRLTWKGGSIPQNAIPFTKNGQPYVLEFDEYTAGTLTRRQPRHGRRRADHRHRRRDPSARGLEPAPPGRSASRPSRRRRTTRGRSAQPRATPPITATSRPGSNPKIVACSFIASGLAGVQHQQPGAPERDRLLRRTDHAQYRDGLLGE